jgi:hypothetical protein
MRKKIVLIMVLTVIAMTACKKIPNMENRSHYPQNYAVMSDNSMKEGSDPIEITYAVGHTAQDCNNSCITLYGVDGHVDCQGWGEACIVTIRIWPIGGETKSATFNALVDTVWSLTSEDFFIMPARSLTVMGTEENAPMYLNIPSQILFRDTTTQQFTFKGLFFSNKPAFSNE